VSPEVDALAERVAAQRGARLLRAPEDPGPGLSLRAAGRFQRRNFALAMTAAEAYLGDLDSTGVAEVAATLTIPGRLEWVGETPPTLLDAAHNPDGAAALAEALPALAAGRPVIGCLAILRDKDAVAMARALAPALDRVVCAELPAEALERQGRPGASSHSATELARICAEAGLPAEPEPELSAALRRARTLASPDGVLLVTGSHYMLSPARSALGLWED
jgi:dihydrofolate synthase/folylpolyglutamate synthase